MIIFRETDDLPRDNRVFHDSVLRAFYVLFYGLFYESRKKKRCVFLRNAFPALELEMHFEVFLRRFYETFYVSFIHRFTRAGVSF